jgi:hypothetical protein
MAKQKVEVGAAGKAAKFLKVLLGMSGANTLLFIFDNNHGTLEIDD